MKLAKIILPENDNAGTAMPLIHADLRHELLTRFGGYTETQGMGGWRYQDQMQREPVRIYEVATFQDAAAALHKIARKIGARARQKSVMIVLPSGNVEQVKAD